MSDLTEAERHPLLDDAGRALMQWAREHPRAPRFNIEVGDRLDSAGLARVRDFERRLSAAAPDQPLREPGWLREQLSRWVKTVPAYRRYPNDAPFSELPTISRSDLSQAVWNFVPDDLPADELIVNSTYGTTGHPLRAPWTPDGTARYLPLLRRALAFNGVALPEMIPPERGVAIALLGDQRETVTFITPSSQLSGAGFVKLNLHPGAWNDPADRAEYLDALNPLIYTGDPISFTSLMALPLRSQPAALISSSMMLLPGLRAALEARFGCPVVDVYSMAEAGPIAASLPDDTGRGRMRLLQHELYVEILDEAGGRCGLGQRGEIVVSGGIDPALPLLRYRTGDYASLALDPAGALCLDGLEGRPPIVFTRTDGEPVNNIDVTHALSPFALPQFTLHQAANGAFTLRAAGAYDADALQRALEGVFGAAARIDVAPLVDEGKVRQYTRE